MYASLCRVPGACARQLLPDIRACLGRAVTRPAAFSSVNGIPADPAYARGSIGEGVPLRVGSGHPLGLDVGYSFECPGLARAGKSASGAEQTDYAARRSSLASFGDQPAVNAMVGSGDTG
jgi:hypothetical protein